jgi:hypothetical protein
MLNSAAQHSLWSHRLFVALFWVTLAGAVTMAVLPSPPHTPIDGFGDKFEHMLAFATLTVLAEFAFPVMPRLRLPSGFFPRRLDRGRAVDSQPSSRLRHSRLGGRHDCHSCRHDPAGAAPAQGVMSSANRRGHARAQSAVSFGLALD